MIGICKTDGYSTMQDLQKEYDLDYNTTQMALLSHCDHLYINTRW